MPDTREKSTPSSANGARFRNLYLRRVVTTAFQILGPERSAAFARWLGNGLFDFALANRSAAETHLEEALGPGLDPSRRDALLRASFAYGAHVWTDAPFARRRIAGRAWTRHFAPDAEIDLLERLRHPGGAILATPHFGNPAIAAYLLARAASKLAMVVDPALDPTQARWSADLDARLPITVMTPERALREAEPWLENGGKLFVVGDHFRAGGRGPRVAYLGRERTFFPTLALWSLRCGVPILVISCRRTSDRGYDFALAAHGEVIPEPDAADPVADVTSRYAAIMEAIVRRHPAHYYWVRRWHDEDAHSERTVETPS